MNPTSNLTTRKLKSYLSPKPVPIAISFKDSKLLNFPPPSINSELVMSQMFPASAKKAPLRLFKRLNRYSKLVKNLRVPTLYSRLLSKEPGPKS